MNNTVKGRRGENIAIQYLKRKKYKLLQTNYRAARCEIDLIMQDGDTLVFIEVKARSDDRFGLGREAVTPPKQKHIRLAAESYMQAHGGMEQGARFDVIELDLMTKNITHIQNAF